MNIANFFANRFFMERLWWVLLVTTTLTGFYMRATLALVVVNQNPENQTMFPRKRRVPAVKSYFEALTDDFSKDVRCIKKDKGAAT